MEEEKLPTQISVCPIANTLRNEDFYERKI